MIDFIFEFTICSLLFAALVDLLVVFWVLDLGVSWVACGFGFDWLVLCWFGLFVVSGIVGYIVSLFLWVICLLIACLCCVLFGYL